MKSKFNIGESVIVFSDGITIPKKGTIIDIKINKERKSFEYDVAFDLKQLPNETNIPEYKILKNR